MTTSYNDLVTIGPRVSGDRVGFRFIGADHGVAARNAVLLAGGEQLQTLCGLCRLPEPTPIDLSE